MIDPAPVARRPRVAWFLVPALVAVVADQVTKALVVRYLDPWSVHPIVDGAVALTHRRNPGAAFSMLVGLDPVVRRPLLIALSLAAMAALVVIAARMAGSTPWPRVALGLALGGAVGNLVDRVWRGSVVDFVLLGQGRWQWPAFNVADAAIVCGVILLLLTDRLDPAGGPAPGSDATAPGDEAGAAAVTAAALPREVAASSAADQPLA